MTGRQAMAVIRKCGDCENHRAVSYTCAICLSKRRNELRAEGFYAEMIPTFPGSPVRRLLVTDKPNAAQIRAIIDIVLKHAPSKAPPGAPDWVVCVAAECFMLGRRTMLEAVVDDLKGDDDE